MKLDDIAKMAIDEVSAELEKIETIAKRKDEAQCEKEPPAKDVSIDVSAQKAHEPSQGAILMQDESRDIISNEEIFLKNLRERIEVLFEGLNEMPKENLQSRLELTLKFLEFTLANVENRLENLPK
ncbi:CiaD-like domain-containing protein [Campylobacter curvus]|uniref:CiaD-like domain-containing protein n=1 Tax=Campylobacter curvus TaxID=200 RepID=UPI00147036CF|nr:GlcNAc transferase [Campylobacter curvus]